MDHLFWGHSARSHFLFGVWLTRQGQCLERRELGSQTHHSVCSNCLLFTLPPSAHGKLYSRQGVEELWLSDPYFSHMFCLYIIPQTLRSPPLKHRDKKCPLAISTFWLAASFPHSNELRLAHILGKGEIPGEKCAKITTPPHPQQHFSWSNNIR